MLSQSPKSRALYHKVKFQLISDIESGVVPPGGALPNEAELGKRFAVSIGTVRRAVDELVAENILVRQQGRGTFVGRQDRERFMFQFFRITARDGSREFPSVRLDSFLRSRATLKEAKALGLQTGESVFRIENVLFLRERPVICDHIVIPEILFPGLTRDIFASREGTIYELYQNTFGLTIVGGTERVSAHIADGAIALMLAIPKGEAVLHIERIAHTFGERPVEYRVSLVDSRDFDYVSNLQSSPMPSSSGWT